MKHILQMFRDLVRFVGKRPEYLACSLVYYFTAVWLLGLVFHSWKLWLFLAIIYILSLLAAFSHSVERLLRLFNHLRPPETAREKELLYPLFDEILAAANKGNVLIDTHIDIFIQDRATVNAFAIGKHTVAVTKGAMEVFSREELKAIIAHEVGHIDNMDTIARLYTIIGNGIFSLAVLALKTTGWAVGRVLFRSVKAEKYSNFFSNIFEKVVFLFMFLLQIALSTRDKKTERQADFFTAELGYGEDMVKALYLLEKMSLSGEASVIEGLISSHPRVTWRIEALEAELGLQDEWLHGEEKKADENPSQLTPE